ncbi:MAG: signal peptidase I [Patescibacteria group bacterium]
MKKIFNFFCYLIIILLVIAGLFLLASILPVTGGYKFFVVTSGSMEPTIHTGSLVLTKAETNYQVGDIITFGKASRLKQPTTHRIFAQGDDLGAPVFTTKGDANNAPDREEIKNRDIIGKVVFSVPYVGYAVDAIKKPIGFILIIFIPAIIIIANELIKIFAEFKKRRQVIK